MKLLLLIAAVLQLSAGALASEFFIYAGQISAVNTGFSNDYHAFAFFPSRPKQCTPGNLNPIRF
ncbi:hypothetical protein B0T18DRAFT_427178 [Schizothecium vesticola]|uniref:Uncharacterized protein n=1 Tax=Schizothecium vesticola TaxID=314040 RepID=A0AA40F0J0_9PEZI|nr:hypothetical protein B0T18DRAFT_427178 [Schizothecium vesticola]